MISFSHFLHTCHFLLIQACQHNQSSLTLQYATWHMFICLWIPHKPQFNSLNSYRNSIYLISRLKFGYNHRSIYVFKLSLNFPFLFCIVHIFCKFVCTLFNFPSLSINKNFFFGPIPHFILYSNYFPINICQFHPPSIMYAILFLA